MIRWNRWILAASVLFAIVGLLFGRETRYGWRDEPPTDSSLVRLEGSLTRNLLRVRGLSLDARFRDGFRLTWIGDARFVPAGLVQTPRGVHLVLRAWGWPHGEAGRERPTLVCWVRDTPSDATTPWVVPLFAPEPLTSGINLSFRRFMDVDDAVVRHSPRLAADELLRLAEAQPQPGACPNLALARSL